MVTSKAKGDICKQVTLRIERSIVSVDLIESLESAYRPLYVIGCILFVNCENVYLHSYKF